MLNSTKKLCYKCLLNQLAAIDNRRNFRSLVEREFRKRAHNPKDQFGTLGRGGTPQVEQLQKEVNNKYMWTSGEEIYEKEAKKVESINRFNYDAFADAKQITVPFAVNSAYVKKIQAEKQALKQFEKKFGIDKTDRLIIECSRAEFNHYEGQKYPAQNIPLVSQYWDKSKYKNEWFVIRRTQKGALSLQHSTPTSWDHFAQDLDPQLLQNIRKCGFDVPTSVQKSVLEMFYATLHLFIAAETGSGKTLAYAAPILSRLLKDKKEGNQSKVIILTVSHLLTRQVCAEITKFSAGLDLNVIDVDKNTQPDDMVFDVLVGEPADISQLLKSFAEPPKISFVVFDEADMLLNDNYVKVMTDFFSIVPISSTDGDDQARAVFVAATCPDELQTIAEGIVEADQLFYVRSEYLHKPLPNIEQMFIRIKEMDKVAKLKEILDEGSETSNRKTMVFCKDRRTAIFVHKTLSSAGFATNLLLNYDASVQAKPNAKVLISTDIGSRGLDIADLKHVINYDFPWHMTDYLHRVGRVGRCSGDSKKIVKSRVTSFVRTIEEVQTAKAIETAIRFGKPLQNVDLKSSMKYQKSRKSKKEDEQNILPDEPTFSE